jgi:hypothetical protein
VEKIPHDLTVVVGHDIRGLTPTVQENSKGGKAIFLDTGSSKFVGDVPGHISTLDLKVTLGGITE